VVAIKTTDAVNGTRGNLYEGMDARAFERDPIRPLTCKSVN
jgi:hypothetical protein